MRPAPVVEEPTVSVTFPDAPSVETPDLKIRCPLTPEPPASTDRIVVWPDDFELPVPAEREITPPVATADDPCLQFRVTASKS